MTSPSVLPAPPPRPGLPATRAYRSWIWSGAVAIGIGIFSIVGLVIYGAIDVDRTVDDMVRTGEGSAVDIVVDSARSWTVYVEPQSATMSGLRFDVLGLDGEAVEMESYGGEMTYSVTGHSGRAVATVALDPGRYRLVVDGSGSRSVAIGASVGGRILTLVIWSAVLGVVLIGGGTVLVILGALRQSRARNRDTRPPPPSAWARGEWDGAEPSRPAQ